MKGFSKPFKKHYVVSTTVFPDFPTVSGARMGVLTHESSYAPWNRTCLQLWDKWPDYPPKMSQGFLAHQQVLRVCFMVSWTTLGAIEFLILTIQKKKPF